MLGLGLGAFSEKDACHAWDGLHFRPGWSGHGFSLALESRNPAQQPLWADGALLTLLVCF